MGQSSRAELKMDGRRQDRTGQAQLRRLRQGNVAVKMTRNVIIGTRESCDYYFSLFC